MSNKKTWAKRSPAYKARHTAKIRAKRQSPEYIARQEAWKCTDEGKAVAGGLRLRRQMRLSEPEQKARRAAYTRKVRLARYGLTEETFGELLGQQKLQCLCCKADISKHNVILYEKKLGFVLGIICRGCHFLLRPFRGSWHHRLKRLSHLIAGIRVFLPLLPLPSSTTGGGSDNTIGELLSSPEFVLDSPPSDSKLGVDQYTPEPSSTILIVDELKPVDPPPGE